MSVKYKNLCEKLAYVVDRLTSKDIKAAYIKAAYIKAKEQKVGIK